MEKFYHQVESDEILLSKRKSPIKTNVIRFIPFLITNCLLIAAFLYIQQKIENVQTKMPNIDFHDKNITELAAMFLDFKNILDRQSSKTKEDLLAVENKIDIQITESTKKLKEFQDKTMPIGFIYVQISKELSPEKIWPWAKWQDISSYYSGLFFRVNGGSWAAPLGIIQEDTAPRLSKVYHIQTQHKQLGNGFLEETLIPASGKSDWHYLISHLTGTGSRYWDYIKFESTGGEVRPRNTATTLWKRIA